MDFKAVFPFETLKVVELIELLQQKGKKLSITELASLLSVSDKTVSCYLKKIQQEMQSYDEEETCQITFLKGGWILYQEKIVNATEYFKLVFLNKIPEIYIIRQLIEGRIIIEELSLLFKKSQSNIRKKIQKIQRWLYVFQIHLTRKEFQVHGDEWQIRRLIANFYHFVQEPIPLAAENTFAISEFASQVSQFFELKLNILHENYLKRLLLISFQRGHRTRGIKLSRKWQLFLERSKFFKLFQEKINFFQTYAFSFEEQSYLFLTIEALFGSYFGKNLRYYFIQEHAENDSLFFQETVRLMQSIKSVFNKEHFNYTEANFCNFISMHLRMLLIQELDVKKHEQTEMYQTRYPNTMGKLALIVEEVQGKYPQLAQFKQEELVLSYFYKIREIFNPICYEKKYFICLITDYSSEKEYLLGEMILSYFKYRKNVAVIYGGKISSAKYTDLFIVNQLIEETVVKNEQPVLFIPECISDSFFVKIEEKLSK